MRKVLLILLAASIAFSCVRNSAKCKKDAKKVKKLNLQGY